MKDFEKELKKHFQERQIQPSQNTWDRMEQLLNEEKQVQKKPIKLYYFLSAAASVLLFVGLWSFFQKTDPTEFPEIKKTEIFVTNNKPEIIPSTTTEVEPKKFTQDKELVVDNHSTKKNKIIHSVSKDIVQNHKTEPKEIVIAEVVQSYPIDQKLDKKIEEKLLANQSKIEIKVNPNKLLRSAEMERQTDNMVSNGQNFWKKVKEINTVVVHSK